jgi:hypothetical protein
MAVPLWKGGVTMRGKIALSVVGVVVTSVVAAGCASGGSSASAGGTAPSSPKAVATESNPPGDIPDNQAFLAYSPPGGGFSVKVPEGWARTAKGSVTTFSDKLNRIELAPVAASAAPTPRSVTDKIVPQLKRQVPNFAMGQVSVVSRHAGKAVLLTYQGDSAADPVTGKVVRDAFQRYAFYRQGHEVDITLSGPVHADNVDPWRIVTDSFVWQ